MKMKFFRLLLSVLLLFFACTPPTEKIPDEENGTVSIYPTKVFNADYLTSEMDGYYYELTAELLAAGSHCEIYVERGAGISETRAKEIASNFDANIFPLISGTFGFEDSFSVGGTGAPVAYNTFSFADWLGNGDGKLRILFYRFKDGFNGTTNRSYVAGFFSINDMWPQYTSSNECDMLHINTLLETGYPGIEEDSGETIAHEFQHLLNFANSVNYRVSKNEIHTMDLWINEGLSSAAEYVYKNRGAVSNGEHLKKRIGWYNGENGTLKEGNNFFVWGNRVGTASGENQYSVLDDYATVYLFFQWLRIQGDDSVYKGIAASEKWNYEAVVDEMRKINAAFTDWKTLLKTWHAANYINAEAGIYGYKGEIPLTAKMTASGTTEVNLYPGEGVYSVGNGSGSSLPDSTANIKYAGLKKGDTLSDSIVPAGGALLTYNVNTNKDGSREKGKTTGIAANMGIARFSRRIQPPFDKPYAISAEDMLGQGGFRGTISGIDTSKLRKKTLINE